MSVYRSEKLFHFFGDGMLISEVVDRPVEYNTFMDLWAIIELLFPFYKIADHITNQDARLPERQMGMCKEIHG